jgi:hypothetical protein
MPFIRPAPLDTNNNPSQADWVDLVTGETEGTDNQVDLSRVQHLIVSGALLSSYFMALANQLGEITGRTIMTVAVSSTAVFTSMPTISQTFFGLLGISHAGFLVFKATATAAPTGGAGDQSGKSKTGTNYSDRSHGSSGALVLRPVGGQALAAAANGRTGPLIHSGDPGAGGGLRPTNGCVRLSGADMSALMTALEGASTSGAAPICSALEISATVREGDADDGSDDGDSPPNIQQLLDGTVSDPIIWRP